MFTFKKYQESKLIVSSYSSNNFALSTTALTAITNQSVTIRTDGRPIFIGFIPDGTSSSSFFGVTAWARDSVNADFFIYRATSTLVAKTSITFDHGDYTSGTSSGIDLPPGSFRTIDNPGAGNYTYTAKAQNVYSSQTLYAHYLKMVAYLL